MFCDLQSVSYFQPWITDCQLITEDRSHHLFDLITSVASSFFSFEYHFSFSFSSIFVLVLRFLYVNVVRLMTTLSKSV